MFSETGTRSVYKISRFRDCFGRMCHIGKNTVLVSWDVQLTHFAKKLNKYLQCKDPHKFK